MSVILKDIKNDYLSIPDTYRIIKYRKYAFSTCSEVEIAKRKSENYFQDDVYKIMNFLFKVDYATQEQIAKLLDIENDSVLSEFLDSLEKNKMLNYFVLSEFEDERALNEENALRIYTIDFGGIYLLALEGVNTLRWRFTKYAQSVQKIRKGLVLAEFYIRLIHSPGVEIKEYNPFYQFKTSRDIVETDFIATINKSGKKQNLLGLVIQECSMWIKEDLQLLNTMFKTSYAYEKYYPQGVEDIPHIICIIPSSEDKNMIKEVCNVFGKTTDFRGTELTVVGYNDLFSNQPIKSYTIRVDEDDEKGKVVKIGATQKNILN